MPLHDPGPLMPGGGPGGRGPTSSAYRACLRGRQFLEKRTIEGFRNGLKAFNRAIALDPGFTLAYVGKADSYQLLTAYHAMPPRQGFPRSRAAAMKALEIGETLAEAHASLGCVRMYYEWDWPGTERDFERSIGLDPTYATAHHWYSDYWTALGRFDRAIERMQKAVELDPLSLMIGTNFALTLYYAGDPDGAIERARDTLEMDPTFPLAHWVMGLGYERQRRHREAVQSFRRAIRQAGQWPLFLASLGHAHAISGDDAQGRRVLAALGRLAKRRYVPAYAFATIHAGLGDRDQAFRRLEQAYRERSDCLVQMKVDPRLAPLRSDPRFSDLEHRVGLAA